MLAVATGVAAASALLAPEVDALREARDAHTFALEELEVQLQALHEAQDLFQDELSGQRGLLAGSDQALATLREQLSATSQLHGSLNADLTGLRTEFHAQTAALERRNDALGDALGQAIEQRRTPPAPDPRVQRANTRAELRRNILSPVFQLTGEDAVGSAVLIAAEKDERGPHHLALTSYHVVRDILGEAEGEDGVVDGYLEQPDGTEQYVVCRLIAKDVPTDLALLRVEGAGSEARLARLAPRQRESQIEVFSPVYTVGCPLGTAAQATRGEVTRKTWQVGGENLWMISSPAYFGNSGGGVFLEETQELIGVFAKIYTHGNYRPQVVTHMGLAVPLPVLHDWLAETGHGHLLPAGDAAGLALATEASHEAEAED